MGKKCRLEQMLLSWHEIAEARLIMLPEGKPQNTILTLQFSIMIRNQLSTIIIFSLLAYRPTFSEGVEPLNQCAANEFQCIQDGKCLPLNKHCDKYFDCTDGSDEEECGICTPGHFKCTDGGCISETSRCNKKADCSDSSDELGCVKCSENEFQCKDGTCTAISNHCNGHTECTDGSDEHDCTSNRSSSQECKPGEKLNNGCNICTCSSDGKNICTKKKCKTSLKYKRNIWQ